MQVCLTLETLVLVWLSIIKFRSTWAETRSLYTRQYMFDNWLTFGQCWPKVGGQLIVGQPPCRIMVQLLAFF